MAAMVDSRSVRSRWDELFDLVRAGEDIIVADADQPVVAMIPDEDYVVLLDELDDLRSARRAGAVLADLKAGRTTTRSLEEIAAEFIGPNP